MTPLRLLLASSLALALASCGNQQPAENYDTTANPYGPADYGYADASTAPYDTNPVYDTPAAYEETGATAADPTGAAGYAGSPNPDPAQSVAGPSTVHTVVKGDTLWGLSRQYNVTIDAIKRVNGMTNDTVVLGQRLQIPSR